MIIDPRPSFQTVWLNQKCWYLKNVQKDVECRRGVKGWLSGSVCVTAGHQSAPGVLEWLPSSSKSILTRIALGKMIIDPPPSFQTVWLNQKCWYLKNVQKDVECRRGVKGWLSGSVGLAYSWPSVSTWGSRMVALKLQKHFDTHCPGEDDYRPMSFFPNGLVEPKVLVPKECAEGCRMQKGCQRMAKRISLRYSWPSVSTWGSRMVAFKLQKHFDTHRPGEDDYRPASFFPNGLVEPKVLVSKECAEGCRMQKGCQRMAKRISWLGL